MMISNCGVFKGISELREVGEWFRGEPGCVKSSKRCMNFQGMG